MKRALVLAITVALLVQPFSNCSWADCWKVVLAPANSETNTCTKSCSGMLSDGCPGARTVFYDRYLCNSVPNTDPPGSGFDQKDESYQEPAYRIYDCQTNWNWVVIVGWLGVNWSIALACSAACAVTYGAGCIACLLIAIEVGIIDIALLCSTWFDCSVSTTAMTTQNYGHCSRTVGALDCPRGS